MTKIGEEIAEKLHITPPQIYVEQTIRPKYACPCCEGTEDEDKPTVRMAPVPASIIPKGIATPGLLSTIMISKYQDHLPFYRQEIQFERIGVSISRQDMSNWQQQVYQKLIPLFALLKQEIKKGPVLNMDETTLQVMGEAGRAYRQFLYVACPERPSRQTGVAL
jgi:transposase